MRFLGAEILVMLISGSLQNRRVIDGPFFVCTDFLDRKFKGRNLGLWPGQGSKVASGDNFAADAAMKSSLTYFFKCFFRYRTQMPKSKTQLFWSRGFGRGIGDTSWACKIETL